MQLTRKLLPFIRSLRWELTFWFGSLSLIILLSAGFYVGGIATRALATQSGEELYLRAKSATDLLETNLRERGKEIDLLSRSPLFVNSDLGSDAVRQVLDMRQQANNEYAWIGVTDVDGKVIQATNGLLVGVQVDQRPWFQEALKGRFVGDVHEAVLLAKKLENDTSDQPLRFIDFAAPIKGLDDELRGVLGAHAHWRWVTDTVESVMTADLAESGIELLIADSDGNVIYPLTLIGEADLPHASSTRGHYEQLRWSDGQEYLTAVLNVDTGVKPSLDWHIVVRQPLQAALAPVEALRNHLWLLGLLAVLIFALIAHRLAAQVSRPIEQLASAARTVARRSGKPKYPDNVYSLELQQLVISVRHMTDSLLKQERELMELNQSLESQVAARTQELSQANRQLEALATQDALTGLANRRRFDEKVLELFRTFRRTQRPFTLMILDIDHFKGVNDEHGHALGDQILRQLADLLCHQIRVTDFVARYGGEEFAVLLPDTSAEPDAESVAEKIREAVESIEFSGGLSITISIGLSQVTPEDTEISTLFERADKALYRVKESGRNRALVG
ncbi:sensor domain-containing diguanylate cyclase [Halomonas sp. LS-001]